MIAASKPGTGHGWGALGLMLVALSGCGGEEGSAGAGAPDGRPENATVATLEDLAGLMTGSFSSQAQSLRDSSFFDIRLEMVRIWPVHPDGIWLYVEQAEAESLGAPYRQRVYHLTDEGDGTFKSTIFALPGNPLSYAGVWRDSEPLEGLTPMELEVREGCAVILVPTQDGGFEGSTRERACGSNLRGATYATTEVLLEDGRLVSWDRGFDDDGNQVWGSTEGGYVFERVFR